MTTKRLKRISRERFLALTFSKLPAANFMSLEVEWYSDYEENVLGVVAIDTTDRDWLCVTLGRDECGLFRAIDLEASVASRDKARKRLKEMLRSYSSTGAKTFPQGDVKQRKNALFELQVPEQKLEWHFQQLLNSHHTAARGIIREIAYAFVDVDGNFIKDFQTAGFSGRLWELFLFAFLNEQMFLFDRTHNRPDFIANKFGLELCMEAVTVNPTDGVPPPKPQSPEEAARLLGDYIPIKFGSALWTKLNKRYWELPQVAGKPLVLAVHDFQEERAMTWTSSGLGPYLYGYRHLWRKENGVLKITPERVTSHTWGDKTIPSNFFGLPGAENISAVLFTNCATLSKFSRMGHLAGFGRPDVEMFRGGRCHEHDENATEPKPFYFEIKPGKHQETWTEGVSLFHNPNALYPLPRESHPGMPLFPGVAHHFCKDGQFVSYLPEFFPYNSETLIMQLTKEKKK